METLLYYFERGVDDGFFAGCENMAFTEDLSDEKKRAYRRGYDHGVWMYCETIEKEKDHV